ncbi:MAG: hypothetical protein Nk1A_6700 [Endomicrobiia bacterium]|nr:MAG: hypothetical protein Nk1A_6700 [Endomicrobiia bacterium]
MGKTAGTIKMDKTKQVVFKSLDEIDKSLEEIGKNLKTLGEIVEGMRKAITEGK